jgi:hypothetical protein
MKTTKAFKEEFPDLTDDQRLTAYMYLEIIAPKGASQPDFRELVGQSIEENGCLLRLRKTVEAAVALVNTLTNNSNAV